jgi:hypothetical protein
MRQQNRPSIYSFDLKKQTKTNKKIISTSKIYLKLIFNI